jgi:glycosyltransferase involved in cell wall biosynthesis
MRILIDQHFHLGHHYHYIAHLLPALLAQQDEAIVAVTPEGMRSSEFVEILKPFAERVQFEPRLTAASPWLPLHERWRVHRELRAAVKRIKPDYVLIPSGDAQTTAMSGYRCLGGGALPGRVPCEVGIHFGLGSAASTASDRIRDTLNRINLSMCGAERVHIINLLFYETSREHSGTGRFSLMPHPVTSSPRQTTHASRQRLGIPEDGRYIGIAGSLDSRKAIGEFLAAFRAAGLKATDRILLAGWMNQTHQRMIDSSFRDLIEQGRLVILNRFLSTSAYRAALSALDVVCTPYPAFRGLSSTLLEGVAAGRPVLAHKCGWMEAIVHRFDLGWTCDVMDHTAFTHTIRVALEQSAAYREKDAITRLLAFHSVDNFAAIWTNGIRQYRGLAASHVLPWNWVEESIQNRLSA